MDFKEELRPVEIISIIKHTIRQDDMNFTYLLAHVQWLKCSSERYKYGKPLQIWHRNEYFNTNNCFIPVQHLGQECAYQVGLHTHSFVGASQQQLICTLANSVVEFISVLLHFCCTLNILHDIL